MTALAHVRSLLAGVNTDAITLAAELLDGMRSAAGILRPLADADTEAGREAAIALQILDDLDASAAPPAAT
jgi:hypothetical protein